MSLVAELRRPEGPPSGAPYPYWKEKQIARGPGPVLGTTLGEKTGVISDERLYDGLFKFT